jgi:hypothetical protein
VSEPIIFLWAYRRDGKNWWRSHQFGFLLFPDGTAHLAAVDAVKRVGALGLFDMARLWNGLEFLMPDCPMVRALAAHEAQVFPLDAGEGGFHRGCHS